MTHPISRLIDQFFSAQLGKYRLPVICLLSLFMVAGCDSSDETTVVHLNEPAGDIKSTPPGKPDSAKNKYQFGFDLRNSPQEDAAQYLPFLSYLEQETGYKFKLRFTSKNKSSEDDLGQGITQFAAVGATASIHATERYGAIPLVRGINSIGKAKYRSMIVVAPDSKLNNVEELRGKRFAFGSDNSTQGHLIPRIILLNKGIMLQDLGSYSYTGSHRNCANAVVSRKADACGMQDTLAVAMEEQGVLRILYTSDYYPSSGTVGNKDVPPQVREKVRQALLNFDPKGRHKESLYHWDRTEMPNGFVATNEKDYQPLKEWMTKLGFLNPEEAS